MGLELQVYTARLPELGTPPAHGFALTEVSAPEQAPGLPHDPSQDRAPLCMALVIDASSSMRGSRFPLAVQATRQLVDSLTPNDRLAVVVFDRTAQLVVAPSAVDAETRGEVHRLLSRLNTGHGTNIAAGWREAADSLSRLIVPDSARRIIVLTDGMPSQGEMQPMALHRMTAEGRQRGIETSVLGICDGIDENLCMLLARGGEGRFHYVRSEALIPEVVAMEVDGARRLAATDVSVSFGLNDRLVRAEVLHRLPVHSDGRIFEVRLGSVVKNTKREVLLQFEVREPERGGDLGHASLRGRPVYPSRSAAAGMNTVAGYALGAQIPSEQGAVAEVPTKRLELQAGVGSSEARHRVALSVLTLRTVLEVRSAWEGYQLRELQAVQRRLGRAREIRKRLLDAGLIALPDTESLPDIDAVEAILLGNNPQAAGEFRRTFTSLAHNTLTSQLSHPATRG